MTSTHPLTDHVQVRRWAEERGATPVRVRDSGTSAETATIRLQFPEDDRDESLQPITWDEWFAAFDASRLALRVEDDPSGGAKHVHEFVSRA